MFFDNPILKREFMSSARSPKVRFFVFVYLFSLAFVLLAMWPGSGVLSAVSESGRKIFELFFSVNLTVLMLLVPAFAATSITIERENDTYASLFTTLLTPSEIMAGKLISSIMMLLILIALSMPIAAMTALTGGVNLIFLSKIALILFMTALSYGLVGLACSSYCSRSSTAILMNYILILVFAGATWLPGALLGNIIGFRTLWQMVRNISPYDAMFYLLSPEKYSMSMSVIPGREAVSPLVIFFISSCIISAVAFAQFFKRILKPPAKFAKSMAKYSDTRTAIKRKLTWPFYLFDPLKRKKNIGRFSNPVYITELRSKIFSNPNFIIRTISGIFIASLCLLTLVAMQLGDKVDPEKVWAAAIIFQTGIVALLTPGLSSGLITDEIINGTFIQLRLTPISPLTVILGKLKATFFYALIFIISSVFILFAMAYLEVQTVFPDGSVLSGDWWAKLAKMASEEDWWIKFWGTYRRLIIWIVILVLSSLTFLSGGLFASSICRRTSIATAVSYSISAFICVITLAPAALGERLSTGISSFILSFNPIISAMQISFGILPQYGEIWKRNIVILLALTTFFIIFAGIRTWALFRKQE